MAISEEQRQRFILGAMVVAILYGIYNVAFSSRINHAAAPMQARLQDVESFVTETSSAMVKDVPSAYDLYVVNKAEAAWSHDPFSPQGWLLTRDGSKVTAAAQPVFVYSGYIEGHGRSVAIINNSEYLAGDPLETEGFFVKKISPSEVIIENQRQGTEFSVPLDE
jgi:type II secretory pathway component PulC